MKKIIITIGGVAICAGLAWFSGAHAATNVSSASNAHWAWNDLIGWMDFFGTDTVTLSNQTLTGYASSSAGDISFDCATTRDGNICGQSNYQVTNDGSGNLSGWAWNDLIGWISFDCHNDGGSCGVLYQAKADPATGIFTDPGVSYAWNDLFGWLSFNCDNENGCGVSDYRVATSWAAVAASGSFDSVIFDTGVAGGAQLNSVMWQGDQPAGTEVGFQFAVSADSNGPWTYKGPDGTSDTYYTVNAGTPDAFDYSLYNNKQYFRYRATLFSDPGRTYSPRIDEIVVNWSP